MRARPSINRDLFDETVAKPFVRRALKRMPGERHRAVLWGVYQKRNGVETCLGVFLSRGDAADCASRLWGH